MVAVAFGLKKAADNGDLDHLDETAKRKVPAVSRARGVTPLSAYERGPARPLLVTAQRLESDTFDRWL